MADDNGNVDFPDRFHGKPESQQPRETGRAYEWFLKYLYMNNRKMQTIIDYATENRELQKQGTGIENNGFFPAKNTVWTWATKFKWRARAEMWDARLREEAIKKMESDRAENIEQFLKNDLHIVMDMQTQIKEYMGQVKSLDNQTERAHILFKLTKTYGDTRVWAKELLADVTDNAAEREAKEAEAAVEAAETEEATEMKTEEAGFTGAPEEDTEYGQAAG